MDDDMERDVEIQLARLTATVESGFRDVNRRFDDTGTKLGRIETQVLWTNGRVSALETKDAVRVNEEAREAEARHRDGSPTLTINSVKVFAQFGGWVVAAIFAALKLMGKL